MCVTYNIVLVGVRAYLASFPGLAHAVGEVGSGLGTRLEAYCIPRISIGRKINFSDGGNFGSNDSLEADHTHVSQI